MGAPDTPTATDEDRRSAMRSPSLPNRTGGSPASGFPVGRRRWTGASHLPIASDRALARRFFAAPTRSALWHGTTSALARWPSLALWHCLPASLRSTVVTRFLATTNALTPAEPF